MTVVIVRIRRKTGVEIGIGDEIDREGEVIHRLMVTDLMTIIPPMEMRLKPERFPSSSELSSRNLMARDHGSPGGLISRTVPRIINGRNVTNYKLAFIKGALTGSASQVLWDTDRSITDSLTKLVEVLKSRYGGERKAEKHRAELQLRCRKTHETLSDLHHDIRD